MANTILKGEIFTDTVSDILETRTGFLETLMFSDYSAEDGDKVTFPILGFVGEATKVVNGVATYSDVKDTTKSVTFEQYDKGVKMSDMELKASRIDRGVQINSQRVAGAINLKLKNLALAELDKQPAVEVEKMDEYAVLDAQAFFGERLEDKEVFILCNAKTKNNLIKNVIPSNKTSKADFVFDSKIILHNAVADDVFYMYQKDVVEILIGRQVQTNVFREADFHGEKINTNIIVSAIITEENRAVKVTLKDELAEG